MPTALITGCNRGIGLEFVRQFVADGWRVYACCRTPDKAKDLAEVAAGSGGKVTIHRLDVGDFAAVDALAAELKGISIDLLLNNAGVFGDRAGFGKVNYEVWERTLRINTMAPHKVTEAFVEHVSASALKRVVHVTSKMGSIQDNTSGGSYVYRSSKTALNMVVRSQGHDLAERGITAIAIHPGWVKTDMGGINAPLSVTDSVTAMKGKIDTLSADDGGKLFNYDGEPLPW